MKEKRYYSGVNIVLLIILIVAMGEATFTTIRSGETGAIVVNGIAIAFIVWLYFSTYYVIKKEQLIIRCTFLKYTIDVERIKEIVPTRTLLSAPALSLNRLMIKTETGPYVISPKKKEQVAFVNHLLSINTKIRSDIKK